MPATSIPILKLIISASLGIAATLSAVLIRHWLGKTKVEAETILNWEEIHAARDVKLLSEIARLEKRDKALLIEVKELRIEVKKAIDEIDEIRSLHRNEIKRWEESDNNLRVIINLRENIISEQEKELEHLRK